MSENPVVLRARGVRREFTGGAGVHGVDLSVQAGEIHALVGLNGAGKTTLLRLVLGMLRPQAGTIELFGTSGEALPAHRWAEVGAQIEYPLAYPELDSRTNLEIAARLRLLPATSIPSIVEQAMTELELTRYAHVRCRRLSLGNRQRLGLAAALQHNPHLIVLDEPTNALDPQGIVLVREAIRRRAEAGAAVLVSSHHLDEVARISHRITVINEGRVIGALDPAGLDLERTFFDLVHSASRAAA